MTRPGLVKSPDRPMSISDQGVF